MKNTDDAMQAEHARLLDDWLPSDHEQTQSDLQALRDVCSAARQQLTDKAAFERLRALGVGVSAALWVLQRLPPFLRKSSQRPQAASPIPPISFSKDTF
jgi:hypothetical protein